MKDDGFNNSLEIDSNSDANDDTKGDDIYCSSCYNLFSVNSKGIYISRLKGVKNALETTQKVYKHERG